jgi:biopolymer transport protein ExbB/TolQ
MEKIINKITLKMSLFLLMSSLIEASSSSDEMIALPQMYLLSMGLVVGVVVLVLFLNLSKQKKAMREKNDIIAEHEEKIKFLRKINAENEYKHTQKEHANEKAIMEFQHTITALEEKINDGTKNQVVAKLEALRSKREQQLNRVNLG